MTTMTAKGYQVLFLQKADRFAKLHGLLDGHDMARGEFDEMFQAVTAAIKRERSLSDLEDDTFKDMMLEIIFGKDKGRK